MNVENILQGSLPSFFSSDICSVGATESSQHVFVYHLWKYNWSLIQQYLQVPQYSLFKYDYKYSDQHLHYSNQGYGMQLLSSNDAGLKCRQVLTYAVLKDPISFFCALEYKFAMGRTSTKASMHDPIIAVKYVFHPYF